MDPMNFKDLHQTITEQPLRRMELTLAFPPPCPPAQINLQIYSLIPIPYRQILTALTIKTQPNPSLDNK